MKLLSLLFGLTAVVSALPVAIEAEERSVAPLEKRAALTDAANIGYATLNGGTTGGAGGPVVTVSNLADLTAAITDDVPRIVVVTGTITGAVKIFVGSNKSIIGKNSSAALVGIGLHILNKKNVIIRNLTSRKILAEYGDAIWVQTSTNVWIDHVDISNDQDHDKDYYDGLIDITRAADYVTVSNSYLHDHWKGSLVGHSDNNGAQDKGHLIVTYANNYFKNVFSRGPSFRFGTGHIYNNFYENVKDGVNTRQGAQLLVESNAFVSPGKPIFATDGGFAVAKDNDLGGKTNTAPTGTLNSVPYSYTKLGSANVKAGVVGKAGATLSF